MKKPSHPESKEYIEFREQTGIGHTGSLMKWVYLRKRTAEGEFEIYSDIDSRIKHYGRIRSVLLMRMVVQLPLLVQNLSDPFFPKNPVPMVMQAIYILLDIFIGIGVVNLSCKMNRLKEERRLRE